MKRERDKDLMEERSTKTIRSKRPKTGQFKCRRSPVNSYAPIRFVLILERRLFDSKVIY